MMHVRQRRSRTLSVLALALAVVMIWPTALAPAARKSDSRSKAEYSKSQFLVKFKPGTSGARIASINRAERVTQRANIKQIGVRVLNVPKGKTAEQMVAKYKKNRNVEFAEVDAIAKTTTLTPNDTYYSKQSTYMKSIAAPEGWSLSSGSTNVTVAVLDTGVDLKHPDLQGRLTAGIDTAYGDQDPSDDHGHGTMVAGIAAANGNNALGVAGIDWAARIMPVKVLSSSGSGVHSGIAEGIVWATDNGADVINMSLGGKTATSTMQDACNYAYSKGVVVVAAAGNYGEPQVLYPAAYDSVVAVGGLSLLCDSLASWSCYGDAMEVSAPGEWIHTTELGGSYAYCSGTSAAAPFVAGLSALILSANPSLAPADVRKVLTGSATDLGDIGWDVYYGWGRIHVEKALVVAGSVSSPKPDEDPEPVADTTAPVVQITTPSNGASVSGTVKIETLASDNVGVSGTDIYVDGALAASAPSASCSLQWDTTKTANGSHTITAEARDAAGNSASTSVIVTVSNPVPDTKAPSVSITSPSDGATVSGGVKIAASASDDTGVSRVDFYVDGKLIGSVNSAPCTVRWDTKKYANGSHTITAKAFDAAGNSASASISVNLSNVTKTTGRPTKK